MARRMSARVLLLLVSAMAVFIVAGAAWGAPQSIKLSLAQSISLAVKQSPQVRLAEIALIEAENAYARVSADQLLPGYGKSIQAAADAVTLAKMSLAAAKDDVAASVEQAYIAVVLANDMVAFRSSAYATAKKQLQSGKAKSNAGLLPKTEVKALEDNLAAAEYALLSAKYNQRLSVLRFNKAVGQKLDTTFTLTDKLEFKPVKVDLKSSLASAMSARQDVIQAKYALERANESLALASNEFTPLADQEQAKLNVEKAQIALSSTITNATIAVEEAYANLINAQNEVDNKIRYVARTKTSLSAVEKKYSLGLVTATSLISAQATFEDAELQKLQAIDQFRSALSAFNRAIGQRHSALAGK